MRRAVVRAPRTGGRGTLTVFVRLPVPLPKRIDELLIKTYPVIAGTGIPVVDGAFDPTAFDVAERTAFPNGATLTHLVRR
ncbi:hypothetical protein RKD27_008947 [Streptomyces sp. SAI-126]